MFQVKSSRTVELECVFVSPLVLWCGDSIWDFVPCQVSYLLTIKGVVLHSKGVIK